MNVRTAKAELQKFRQVVAPQRPLEVFIRIEGETENEALARHGLDEWPEDPRFIHVTTNYMAL